MDLERDRQGGRRLEPDARRQRVAEGLPAQPPDLGGTAGRSAPGTARISNSDPITGQAAWYDVRVKIIKVGAGETAITSPQFEVMKPYPGMKTRSSILAFLGKPKSRRNDPARVGHRPQRLRRLPGLRDLLQGVEHLGEAGPMGDQNPYGADPTGTFFNRVQTFEVGEFPNTETVHFPKSCLHCEDPPCVPVCPTGASYKRKEDGIVLVDYDKCIGCKYCSWACPYGARELDEQQQVMKKCTLCVDRIYDMTMAGSRSQAVLRQGLPDLGAPVRRRA
jgi:ferredoxin